MLTMKLTILTILTLSTLFAEDTPAPATAPTDAARAAILQAFANLTMLQSRSAARWRDIEAYFKQLDTDLTAATAAYQQSLAAACPVTHQLDLTQWQQSSVLNCVPKPVQSGQPGQPTPAPPVTGKAK